MSIKVTNHAQISLSERKIAQHEIEDTVKSPDKTERQSNGLIKAEKRIGKRLVTVIYTDQGKVKVLITAWVNDVV
jgi:hypothetical protein